jgi:DNA polymerase-4
MQAMLRQALPYTPLVEAGNTDGHLFMDVSGSGRLFGNPSDIACRIRRSTQNHLGLNPIWTVATNKLVAKAASRLVKPSGEYVVAPGTEESFLFPLPLPLLPGLFRQELIRLQEFNLHITGQAAALSLSQLMIPFGKRAEKIYCAVRGIDSTPVFSMARTPLKICVEHFFSNESNDWNRALAVLFELSEKAGRRLRHIHCAARQISVWLEYADKRRAIRQTTVKKGLCHDDTLFSLAQANLQRAWTRRVQLRCLRLICDKLTPPPPQAFLFQEEKKPAERRQNLTSALDRIRGRHGETSIRHGRCLAY